jgi:hypothetical protein
VSFDTDGHVKHGDALFYDGKRWAEVKLPASNFTLDTLRQLIPW